MRACKYIIGGAMSSAIKPKLIVSRIFHILGLATVFSNVNGFLSGFKSKWVSFAWIILLTGFPLYFIAELVYVNQELEEQNIGLTLGPGFDVFKNTLEMRLKQNPSAPSSSVYISPFYSGILVRPGVKVTASFDEDNIIFNYENYRSYNFAIVVVFSGLWLVLLYSMRIVGVKAKPTMAQALAALSKKPLENGGISSVSLSTLQSNIDVLKDEVLFARNRATEVYVRSSIMLVAGVVMAFVGVAAYYVSVPVLKEDARIESFL